MGAVIAAPHQRNILYFLKRVQQNKVNVPPELSHYERNQALAIAQWKGEQPGRISRVINRVANSMTQLSDKLLPEKPIKLAIEAINKAAAQISRDDSILNDPELQKAGITSIPELGARTLEFSDTLADRYINEASQMAAGMGAATGAGGPISVAVGIPTLLFSALRIIHRVAACYGHEFSTEAQKGVWLGILSLSTATSPQQRAHAMDEYQRRIETSLVHAALEESANKALQRAVLGRELGSVVPGFNIALNAYLNRQFIIKAGVAAKRVFQEQRLRDEGKVDWIRPSSS